MYESGVTCSGRTPRSSTLSILSPPPSPLIAHGVHARTPTTKSKPATVRRGTGHVPTTPFRASMCVCACATTSIPPFDFSFLGKIRNWLENSNPRPFEMLCILDSKVEMEEMGEGQCEGRRRRRTLAGGGFSRSRYRATSDASSYYYLPPLTWHCYEPPIRGRRRPNEEWEKDACGKSVLRDKS